MGFALKAVVGSFAAKIETGKLFFRKVNIMGSI